MSVWFIVAVPIVLVVGLLIFARSSLKRRDARSETIGLMANIATIVGMVVTVCAVVYAVLQYQTYTRELSRKPSLDIRVTPRQIPAAGFVRYASPDAKYTEPMKIQLDAVNRGEAVGREVFATIAFSPNVQVLSVDYGGKGFEVPMPGEAIFMFSNPEYPVPPSGPPLPLMEFTIRLKRTTEKKLDVAALTTNVEGKPFTSYKVVFVWKSEKFEKTKAEFDKNKKYTVQHFPLRGLPNKSPGAYRR